MNRQVILIGSIMVLLLAGCSFTPEYNRPEAPVSQDLARRGGL